MMERSGKARLLLGLAVLLAGAAAARAQAIVKVNDDVFFRFGVLGQVQADWTEDATEGGYQQNLFLRRARIVMAGQAAKNVSFFLQTDAPNLGKYTPTGKNVSSGFKLQDFFVQWKASDAFYVSGGLQLVPLSRQVIIGPSGYLTMDVSPASAVADAPTQSNGFRDYGFLVGGWVAGSKLEYRAGVFQGLRETGSHNSFRAGGMLQYNFFEPEKGYVYPATYLGKKKVMGVHAGVDTQGEYLAYSGNFYGMIPMGGNEVAWEAQYAHYDGDGYPLAPGLTPAQALKTQDTYLAELGYYFAGLRLQPFVKWESQQYDKPEDQPGDYDRIGLGFNWYVAGQNFKVSGQYQKADYDGAALKDVDQYTLQMQVGYY